MAFKESPGIPNQCRTTHMELKDSWAKIEKIDLGVLTDVHTGEPIEEGSLRLLCKSGRTQVLPVDKTTVMIPKRLRRAKPGRTGLNVYTAHIVSAPQYNPTIGYRGGEGEVSGYWRSTKFRKGRFLFSISPQTARKYLHR